MTDYGIMMDRPELTEEEKKRDEERKKRSIQYSSVVEPLMSGTENFAVIAKKGRSTKKARDKLLREIDDAEELGIKLNNEAEELGIELKIGYPGFEPDDERIKVLGAYQLCMDYKRK